MHAPHKRNVYLMVFFSFFMQVLNNDLQPPNYYEVMEFDPLAPATE